jgi:xanthine dehydrogenase molybdopterin-binding subunit B
MNTYATLTNAVNNKSTRVLVRNGTINSRQCNDAINRVSGGTGAFHLKSDIPVTVLNTVPALRITNNGMRWTDTDHIIQNSEKRYTVVYNIEYDTTGKLSGLKYAVARTAPRDNFSRKLGRTIATGRLNSDKPNNVKRIPLNGKVPTTGKEWQVLENELKTIVERDFRLKIDRRYGE